MSLHAKRSKDIWSGEMETTSILLSVSLDLAMPEVYLSNLIHKAINILF